MASCDGKRWRAVVAAVAAGLLAGACATAPAPRLADGEACYQATYGWFSAARAAAAREVARRGLACDARALAVEHMARIDKANEQPSPYYYGGPP